MHSRGVMGSSHMSGSGVTNCGGMHRCGMMGSSGVHGGGVAGGVAGGSTIGDGRGSDSSTRGVHTAVRGGL
jgi:hypothetical protein